MLEKSADVSKIQTIKQKTNYILNLYNLQHFSFLRYKQRKLTEGPTGPTASLIGLKKKVLRGSHSPFVN